MTSFSPTNSAGPLLEREPSSLRIGDTAEWRMTVFISSTRMAVYLQNTAEAGRAPVVVLDREWESNPDTLLANIENTVYDHPLVLDDFTADIMVESDKVMWVPRGELEYDGAEETIFNSAFPTVEPHDIMADESGREVCLFTLTPGLGAFLSRTFPGARVLSHLSAPLAYFRDKEEPGSERVYIDLKEGHADYYAFHGSSLVMCASHEWRSLEDAAYHALNISEVFGLERSKLEVYVAGADERKGELASMLRDYVAYSALAILPRIAKEPGLPLCVGLRLSRRAGIPMPINMKDTE